MAISDGTSAIANLAVGFGGFSPTAMAEMGASKEQIKQVEELHARKKELAQHKRELDRARSSSVMKYEDAYGSVWSYVVVDDTHVRITGCQSTARILQIPDEVDDRPVFAVGPDACARLDAVEEIICPDSIVSIGSCAFRLCKNLRAIKFSENVSDFSAGWLQKCESIERITLPGMLESISSAIFENSSLKTLAIGRSVSQIKPGAFEKTQLVDISIDEENPYIRTDGTAIYSKDDSILLALARPVERYAVTGECKAIATKAFNGIKTLKAIDVADGLEVVGEFAFAHSGLVEFTAPSSLTTIEEKAFFHCRDLREVTLNEGIMFIKSSSFAETGLSDLFIPASIEEIGSSVTTNTAVVHSGPDATLKIDPRSKSLFLDEQGGLYRREGDGIHLIQLVDANKSFFKAIEGTRVVDSHAFAFNRVVESVVLPEGVEEIGESAFRVCDHLRMVDMPDSVRLIGDDAFLDTVLESFYVPAALERLGNNALVTCGAHRGGEMPTLSSIQVGEGNKRFYMHGSMLCERTDQGDTVVLYTGEESHVVIPNNIVSIRAYAFSNARGIESMSIGSGLKTIDTAGLSVWCWIRDIHIELPSPLEGRAVFDFQFPHTPKSIHEISISLGGSSWVNVPDIMKHFDNCVVSCHDYNSNIQDGVSAYEQIRLVLNRLEDPILLSNMSRGMYERLFKQHICAICVDIARHDDRDMMNKLVEMGFLNEGNLEEVIAAVGKLQDAAMTGFLLELKRCRFNRAAIDFDL